MIIILQNEFVELKNNTINYRMRIMKLNRM